jgi:CRP/FNR family transcriptional regulator, cyclic AMP receptor protein
MVDVGQPAASGRRAALLDEVVEVADLLPDLIDDLPQSRLEAVRPVLRARALRLRRGRWAADVDTAMIADGIGFLVVEGAVMRCVAAAHRTGGELLGPGDVLRPSVDPLLPPFSAYWRAVVDTKLAVLDARFARASASVPEVTGALVASATRRAGMVGRQLVIAQSQSVETRILATLRQLADRWGVMTAKGIVLPQFLSHGTLALLLGARRPSVTSAMVRLSARGAVSRRPDGRWLLLATDDDHAEPVRALPSRSAPAQPRGDAASDVGVA